MARSLPKSLRSDLTLSQALNQKIRELLVRKHWSQGDLARKLGLTQSAVSYLLLGKRRTTALDFYEDLAHVFGMPLSELLAQLEVTVRASKHAPVLRTRRSSTGVVHGESHVGGSAASPATATAAFEGDLSSEHALPKGLDPAQVRTLCERFRAIYEDILCGAVERAE